MGRLSFLTRRQFLRKAAWTTLGVGCTTLAYMRWVEPYWVEVVRRDLPITGLPAGLDGQTLVHLSDIHVGGEVSDDYLRGVFRTVAEMEPDWVVCTGDYMTCIGTEQINHVARVLKDFPHGRVATLGILGNHDYASTWKNVKVADQVTRRLSDLGIQMLRNDQTTVRGLTVVGIEDFWSPLAADAGVLLRKVDVTKPCLVLAHNPDWADQPIWGDYKGWILSGHTHGGQCQMPFVTPYLIPVKNKRYIAGDIDVGQGRRLYINRGLGSMHNLRLRARPEITVFTLRIA
jgi:predicted MPP superfamily phosphohydrolase